MSRNQYSMAKNYAGPQANGASSLTTQILNQAIQHHQFGRIEEAEQLYRKILEIDAHHPGGLHMLGVILNYKGDYETALNLISQAIQLNGGMPSYHNSLGTVFSAQGKTKEAAAAYERALNIDPDYSEAHLNMGNIFINPIDNLAFRPSRRGRAGGGGRGAEGFLGRTVRRSG